MSDRVQVCPVEEFESEDRKFAVVDGTSVGVVRVDGEFYALENECPHQHGPVCTGKIGSALVGEFVGVGERVVERLDHDTKAISCPWHGWEFNLETGAHLGDGEFTVRTYDVVVEDGSVYVESGAGDDE